MTNYNDQDVHPIIPVLPIENYLALEGYFLTKFYEKNSEVFNSLVVCHYKFLIDRIPKHETIGEVMNKDVLSLHLRDSLLAALLTYYKVGEEIGYISRTYWEHCYNYIESFKGPPRLLGFLYRRPDSLTIHLDFCSYIIRGAFADNFDRKIRNNQEYVKCCKLVKEANKKKGIVKMIELEESRI